MSKRKCKCPTSKMCCGQAMVPTKAYQLIDVPRRVYDNVPESVYQLGTAGNNLLPIIILLSVLGSDGNFSDNDNLLLLLLLLGM